jgi:hypothetical protein
MAGRGATTFQKRQKEMQRKERQQEKFAKRLERKKQADSDQPPNDDLRVDADPSNLSESGTERDPW